MTSLLIDFTAAIGDARVWASLVIALLAVPVLVVVGVPVARRIGLLDASIDGDRGTTFAVGLSVGLVVVAAAWASVASGFRSVFVPVAAFLIVAIALGPGRLSLPSRPDRRAFRTAGAAAAFVVVMGMFYASTIAPSPRDGVQPVEFFDVGFYSSLGADLAQNGTESIYSPGAVEEMGASVPDQTWYHWGELWLAALVIDITGISPIHARHLVVLPILLLAAATLGGALVRRVVSRPTTESFVLGAACMLFLAPIPLVRDVDVEWFPRSLVFGITQYGMVVIVILLGIHALIAHRFRPTIAGALGGGVLVSALIASHVGVAAVGLVALALFAATRIIAARERTRPWEQWAVPSAVVAASVATTAAWGYATGHGFGGLGAMEGIGPFDRAWGSSMVGTVFGAGVILVAPLVFLRSAHPGGSLFGTLVGALGGTLVAALAWGVLVADLNMFHVFFGALVTILTPIAVLAALSLLTRAREGGRRSVATILLVAILGQSTIAAVLVGVQLRALGTLGYDPTPVAALARLQQLPRGSKAAYGCDPLENFAPWDYGLISIEAHTGVRLVPMCFMADRGRRLLGRELDSSVESPFFRLVPQRDLYPATTARPSDRDVDLFLRSNGIGFVYADGSHPELLSVTADPVFREGSVTLHALPGSGLTR